MKRADRKRRHLGLGFERRDWSDRQRLVSSVLALLDCSFAHFYKTVVGLLAREGVTGWEERVVSLLLSWGEFDLWVGFLCHNRVGLRQGLNS